MEVKNDFLQLYMIGKIYSRGMLLFSITWLVLKNLICLKNYSQLITAPNIIWHKYPNFGAKYILRTVRYNEQFLCFLS